MYVGREQWSVPEDGDPPPCFRQGDVVRINWVRVDPTPMDGGKNVRFSVEHRTAELVVLVSTCCDLVMHDKPKRKGFLVCPLKPVPKNIARNPDAMKLLQATASESVDEGFTYPNHFYYAELAGEGDHAVDEGVVFLEAITMIEAVTLKAATKVAELTPAARADFKERLKHHFARGAP